jgi:hypothetical protein
VSDQAAALAVQVRHVSALVADAIGQAQLDGLPIPDDVYPIQNTLLGWARRLEQRRDQA